MSQCDRRGAWSLESSLLAAAMALLAACGAEGPSSAAPPLVICGTTMSSTAAGAVLYDATTDPPLIVARSAGDVLRSAGDVLVSASSLGVVFLRLANGCSRGVTLSIEPASAATIAREARADDGLTVAVALDVVSPVDIQVTGTRDGKVVASVEIHLPPTAG